jgi:DNA polymerase-3 subunit delta'
VAEEETDPREVAWHPRHTKSLLGHLDAERRMRQAFDSGKLHHAWMISGSKGIGKASLAYRFAAYVLAAAEPVSGDLGIDPVSRTAHWLASRSHPDLFVLERNWDSKTKKLKSELAVDDARQLSEFFGLTAGSGGWRVAIIDAADDLNNLRQCAAEAHRRAAAQVPAPAGLQLPGRLLRTIRSRCLRTICFRFPKTKRCALTNLPLDERRAMRLWRLPQNWRAEALAADWSFWGRPVPNHLRHSRPWEK